MGCGGGNDVPIDVASNSAIGVPKNNARTYDSSSRNLVSCREDSAAADPYVRSGCIQAFAGKRRAARRQKMTDKIMEWIATLQRHEANLDGPADRFRADLILAELDRYLVDQWPVDDDRLFARENVRNDDRQRYASRKFQNRIYSDLHRASLPRDAASLRFSKPVLPRIANAGTGRRGSNA